MASFNKIRVIGRVGGDPELVYTTSGAVMIKFPLATTYRWTDITGIAREHSTLFCVQFWGQRAEKLCGVLARDSIVFVYGRLRIIENVDRQGNRRATVELSASDIQTIESV